MKNKKIQLFIRCLPVLLLLPFASQGQGIDIGTGASIAVTGAASIELNNQGFINNGTYTKGSETVTFSGNTAKTISGTSLSDFNNLLLTNTGGVSIADNSKVTVSGTLSVSGSSLTLNSTSSGTASLIHSNTGVTAIVQRYIAGWSDALHGWHFLSSPNAAQAISVFHTAGSGNDFYKWDEPSNLWINRTAPGGSLNGAFEANFAVGKGYLIANATTTTPNFTGSINVGDVGISGLTLTGSQAYTGWHLLGNPFSSALDWNASGWLLSSVDANCQIWNETSASYTVVSSGNGIIPAMNGFMVHASAGGASLTIPAAARTHNAQTWYKNSESDNSRIVLVARDPEGLTAQESVIRIDAQATAGYDTQFDSYYIAGFAPLFYSLCQNEKYALNTLPDVGTSTNIPMGFVKNGSSQFTIELSENIQNLSVYLTDQKTGLTQKLNDGNYSFSSEEGDDANRFLLHFSPMLGIGEHEAVTNFSIYATEGKIKIASLAQLGGKVNITDMAGRNVASGRVEAGATTFIDMKGHTGVYIVSVLTSKGVNNTKIVVK